MEGMELEQANGLQLEQNAQFSKVSTTLKSNQSFETHFSLFLRVTHTTTHTEDMASIHYTMDFRFGKPITASFFLATWEVGLTLSLVALLVLSR